MASCIGIGKGSRSGLKNLLIRALLQLLRMLVNDHVDNFYVLDAELTDSSPSRLDNVDFSTETTLRHYGAELIQKAGILLGCQQAVMVTGQVLLQRFYCKKSLREFNIQVGIAVAFSTPCETPCGDP